jgi:hypothetical protein
MSVRSAKFADIPRLCELIAEAHARSVYADRAALDESAFKKLCINSARIHGQGGCLFVAERDGLAEGFIIGVVDRIYGILKAHYATDVLFIAAERADPRDAGRLLDAFLGWADSVPSVIEVRLGVSDAIGPWERTAKLYRRKGLRQDGAQFVKEFTR